MAIGNANGTSWLWRLLFNIWPYFENIGRLLIFTDSTDVIDQIGDETRKLEPDRCIINDRVGGGVILDSAINYTTYAYGYRLGQNNVFEYTDGTNRYTYTNGVLTATTPDTAALNITQLNLQTGDNYHHVIFDTSARTAEEINTYFQANAPLFNSDTMVDDSNFEYHRYLMNEKGSSRSFDSGTAATKIHGTYFYDDITKPVDTLHDTTTYPEILKNRSNREGWNKGAWFNGIDSKIKYSETVIVANGVPMFLKCSYIFDEISSTQLIMGYPTTTKISKVGNNRIIVYGSNGAYLNMNWYLNPALEAGVIYDFEVRTTTTQFELLVNGISAGFQTPSNNSTDIFINSISGNVTPLFGYAFDLNYNNEIIDPLNGSTTGTPTNIDFNKIVIPNNAANIGYDIFGRESLYTGIAKINALWDAGKTKLDFNPTNASSIGETAFRFFDASDTAVWDGSAAWQAEYDALYPFAWNAQMLDPTFILAHVNAAWERIAYKLIKSGVLKEIVAYKRQLTAAEQTAKMQKYLPQY